MSLFIAFAAGMLCSTVCTYLHRKINNAIVIPLGSAGGVPDVAYRIY